MDWSTVGQVLTILAGAGAYQWWSSRESRPRSVRVLPSDPVERTLVQELETLAESKRLLYLEHTDHAGAGWADRASIVWQAACHVELRMTKVRDDLAELRASRPPAIGTETVY